MTPPTTSKGRMHRNPQLVEKREYKRIVVAYIINLSYDRVTAMFKHPREHLNNRLVLHALQVASH